MLVRTQQNALICFNACINEVVSSRTEQTLNECFVTCVGPLSVSIGESELVSRVLVIKNILERSLIVNRHILQVIPPLHCQVICIVCRQIRIESPSLQNVQVFAAKLIWTPITIRTAKVLEYSVAKLKTMKQKINNESSTM